MISAHNLGLQQRRKVQPLPATTLNHVTVGFEEKLFSQALALLSSVLSGSATPTTPAFVPPAQHLAFIATLALHPHFTTRTASKDKHIAADDALRYLREVIRTIDPTSAVLLNAFRFQGTGGRTERPQRTKHRRSGSSSSSDGGEDRHGQIQNQYANSQSLWTRAEDFWNVVGWAFNCSVKSVNRWGRWKHWLDAMLDLLDANLDALIQAADQQQFSSALIVQYLSPIGGGRNNKRKILRAILADGSKRSAEEFGEIWQRETELPRKQETEVPSKRRRLDLANAEFGNYFDTESDEDNAPGLPLPASHSSSRGRPRRSGREQNPRRHNDSGAHQMEADRDGEGPSVDTIENWGGFESIRLRQRLLALLVRLSEYAPTELTDTAELLSLYTEFLRPLPLITFQQFVTPLKPYLSSDSHATLCEMIFQALTGHDSTKISNGISQEVLEEEFAPRCSASTSADDNAKVSILIESLMRELRLSDLLSHRVETLTAKIEHGISAREEKVTYDRRKKNGDLDESYLNARAVMQDSAERMRVILSS